MEIRLDHFLTASTIYTDSRGCSYIDNINGRTVEMILIIGSIDDKHVSSVCSLLNKERYSTIILYPINRMDASFEINEFGQYTLDLDHFDQITPTMIWYRNKMRPVKFPRSECDADHNFRFNEWFCFYRDIQSFYENITLNNPLSRARMAHKFYQMCVARKIGFNIPKSIMSTSRNRIKKFVSENKANIIKTISGYGYGRKNKNTSAIENVPIPTTIITENNLETLNINGDYDLCPSFIQNYIDKKYELRVVCVNDTLIAYRIERRSSKEMYIDWRPHRDDIDFTKINICYKLEEMIKNYLKEAGLFYGIFDLAVDKDDKAWFLECNPDGQWYWLDDDGAISCIFAEQFARFVERQGRQTQ